MYGAEGKIVRAARLWGAEEALLEKLEDAVYTYLPDRALHRSQVAAARSQVDEAAWDRRVDRGTGDEPRAGRLLRA